jgi:hypothetical protein
MQAENRIMVKNWLILSSYKPGIKQINEIIAYEENFRNKKF